MSSRYRVSSLPPENDRLWLCVMDVRVTARCQSVFEVLSFARCLGSSPGAAEKHALYAVESVGVGTGQLAVSATNFATSPVTNALYSPALARSRYLDGEDAAT